jgi:hypothetical protein
LRVNGDGRKIVILSEAKDLLCHGKPRSETESHEIHDKNKKALSLAAEKIDSVLFR